MDLFTQWLYCVVALYKLEKKRKAKKTRERLEKGLRVFWAEASDKELEEASREIAKLFNLEPKAALEALKEQRIKGQKILRPHEWN